MENLIVLMIILLDILLLLGVIILSIYIIELIFVISFEIGELFCDFFERRKEKEKASLKGTCVFEKEFSNCPNTFEEEEDKDE